MLDINLFRTDPEAIRESQRRRFADVGLVDKVVGLDTDWRRERFELDQLRREFNALNKQVAATRKAGGDAAELQAKAKAMKEALAEGEVREAKVLAERDAALVAIGNLVHDSVPVSANEEDNVVVRTRGEPRQKEPWMRGHVELCAQLGIVDTDAGAAVAGSRGYYLLREGPLLNQALVTAALHFAHARGYEPVHTPFFMRTDVMAECAQLSQFDDELYRVVEGGSASGGDAAAGDRYLIATSEQTLCAMHRRSWFERAELPRRLVGYSTCFRREAGSHGRDTLGIFRVHQFEKIEQFVVTDAERSWDALEEMLRCAEDFYAALGLPYRVVNIVSGELNNAAAKKYDLEAWFPASGAFRELVSASNCTDYQARRLDVRLRAPKGAADADARTPFVHMLNATLTATERTLCCVLEHYQTRDGVVVPDLLRPFMPGGMEFIPFRQAPAPQCTSGK